MSQDVAKRPATYSGTASPSMDHRHIHMFANPIALINLLIHGCVHAHFKHVWCINAISCVTASKRPFSSGTGVWNVSLESGFRRLRLGAYGPSLGKAAWHHIHMAILGA